MSTETLKQLLAWLTAPGAGIVAWWLIDQFKIGLGWTDEHRRWLALAVSGVLALGAWWAQIAMLYQPMPADWRAGVEQGVAILFTAFGVSQLAHARVKQERIARAARMAPRG